jgi:tRNA pseudouridine55 synthase
MDVNGSDATLRAHVSGGTYIRSIAHDLGQAMGCGAHLQELRRISSGEFELAQAHTLAHLEALGAEDRLLDAVVPAAQMLPGFPGIYVDDLTALQIRNGRNFPASPFRQQADSKYIKALTRGGELVAIGEAVLTNLYHPMVVL